MAKWKKKPKIKWLKHFIKDFSLFVKKCNRFTWKAEKIQKVKIQKFTKGRTMLLSKCAVRG